MLLSKIERAISDIQSGKMIIIVDDETRENEGDLVIAAEKITSDAINFMVHEGCGLICMPMSAADFARLNIPMMVNDNQSTHRTAFGVSIGAAKNITTGISAADRAETIRVAANVTSTEKDIVKPGHIFPLKAEELGVLKRKGHTEASVDLMKMAGLRPAAAICEIMNRDGTMAQGDQLTAFAKLHDLTIISVQALVEYRLATEIHVEKISSAKLPTEYGEMMIHHFQSALDQREWIAITSGDFCAKSAPLVRLHSQCLTGDAFGSSRCDCGDQLKQSMRDIAKESGVIVYLPQEGRDIGLMNKIKAYALQDTGLDTVEANHELGLVEDAREYFVAVHILKSLGLKNISLMTNNPKKITEVEKYGMKVEKHISILSTPTCHNQFYLETKKNKMGHLILL